MKIKKVELENFKCFEDIKINIGKLTLLTGANSSGKSSIIYSLLGAIQSDNFPFDYSLNGKFVRMGDYKDVIFEHDSKLLMKINLLIEYKGGEINIQTCWENNLKSNLPEIKELNVATSSYNLKMKKLEKSKKYNLTFDINPEVEPAGGLNDEEWFRVFDATMSMRPKDKSSDSKESFTRFLEKFVKPKERIDLQFSDFQELEKLIYTKGNYTLAEAIGSITSFSEDYEKTINFISSFRLYPEQTYYEESQKNIKVGRFGEKYQDQLIDWENRKSSELKQLLKEMKNLNLIEDIKLKRFGGGRFEVLVKVKQNSIYAALSDVGFGVSQFLPIIVADLQLGKNSNLIVAQPEIHLHPSVQAKFGDYIVDQIVNNDKSYIVETHSEYLLNRIRLAIVKGEINEEDVSVYYLENDGKKSISHELVFKKNGQIDNAPLGFFETYMMDVMEIALTAE